MPFSSQQGLLDIYLVYAKLVSTCCQAAVAGKIKAGLFTKYFARTTLQKLMVYRGPDACPWMRCAPTLVQMNGSLFDEVQAEGSGGRDLDGPKKYDSESEGDGG